MNFLSKFGFGLHKAHFFFLGVPTWDPSSLVLLWSVRVYVCGCLYHRPWNSNDSFLLLAQHKFWPIRKSEARTDELPRHLTVVHCDLVVVNANAEITGNCWRLLMSRQVGWGGALPLDSKSIWGMKTLSHLLLSVIIYESWKFAYSPLSNLNLSIRNSVLYWAKRSSFQLLEAEAAAEAEEAAEAEAAYQMDDAG